MTRSDGMLPIETIGKGKRWFRVYWENVHPTRFTESRLIDPPWRFSPFEDKKNGDIVQALYMGDSAMGAMAETIFRKEKSGALLPSEVDQRFLCQLTTQCDLTVAVLTDEFLQAKLGYNPIASNDYERCLDIAKLLYHRAPTPIDGLIFPSYQTDSHNMNLVVFSTRVKPKDFRVAPNSKDQVYSDKYKVEFLMAVDVSNRLLSDALRKKIFS